MFEESIMNKSDYSKPEEHIFYCDKSDWYTTNKEGEKDWSNSRSKVEEFWRMVREQKMAKKDFDFSEFIFPYFLVDNFWNENQERIFPELEGDSLISFHRATFEGAASFERTTFKSKASFHRATFEGEASFFRATFEGEASFWRATFKGEAYFGVATFEGEAYFVFATFEGQAFFGIATFKGKLFFTDFYCNKKGMLLFYRTEFSIDEISKFSQWDFGKGQRPWMRFEEVVFPDKVEFLKCDFSKVEFVNGDLVEVKFSNCIFPKSYGRVKFINEKISTSGSKLEHYTMVGEVYRQLKKNQMEAKNWVEAGDAYQSEMTMRRRFLWKRYWQKPWWRFTGLFSWFINVLHYLLSVYQQSMLRPVAIMFVAWIGFASVFYWDWQHANQIFAFDSYDFGTHLLDSAFNLLAPLGRLNAGAWKEANNELLIRMLTYIERLLGGILLTFFILATRARLKQ